MTLEEQTVQPRAASPLSKTKRYNGVLIDRNEFPHLYDIYSAGDWMRIDVNHGVTFIKTMDGSVWHLEWDDATTGPKCIGKLGINWTTSTQLLNDLDSIYGGALSYNSHRVNTYVHLQRRTQFRFTFGIVAVLIVAGAFLPQRVYIQFPIGLLACSFLYNWCIFRFTNN